MVKGWGELRQRSAPTARLWAATNDALYRIDPFTGRVIDTTEITGSTGLTVADGTVWVVDDFSVDSFGAAILATIIVWAVNTVLEAVFTHDERRRERDREVPA